jgi:hypothetical protein
VRSFIDRGKFALVAMFAALSIYCTHAALNQDGGPIPDASGAEGCCEICPVEQPTVVFDGDPTWSAVPVPNISPPHNDCLSPAWDAAEFRSVVVRVALPQFADLEGSLGQTGFVRIATTVDQADTLVAESRFGQTIRVRYRLVATTPCSGTVTVHGYRSR